MQSLAAYSFEASFSDSANYIEKIDRLIDDWLIDKGAADPRARDGDFTSKTGDGTGQFSRAVTSSKLGSAREIELIETTHTQATFTTLLQIAATPTKVSIFVSLYATPGTSVVAPVRLSPRCPGIIRTLITEPTEWKYAGQEVPVGLAFDATTHQGARILCDAINSPGRKLPLLVISADSDEQVWERLHTKAAHELIGLADVAYVNEESSWVLTETFGAHSSCYLGAVRLYWPVRRADGVHESSLWRPARLLAFGDGTAGRNRFLAHLRAIVMTTAALTMVPPSTFREIQNAAMKERLHSMEGASRDAELDSIIEENASLSSQLEAAQHTVATLQWRLAALNSERSVQSELKESDSEGTGKSSTRTSPQSGEVRYYKKIGSGGGVDTLVEVKSCNHKNSSWRSAFKGDQAEKGLQKLEGRSDWQSLSHCSACTGGGRWKVHW